MVVWFLLMVFHHMGCLDIPVTTLDLQYPGDVVGEDSTDIFHVLAAAEDAGGGGEDSGCHKKLVVK
jgi:hypothetical protein